MSSNINPYNIDGTFPVAGQDNPSQGFRDNFTNIKNNFIFAQNEIDDLQSKSIVTSALNGQSVNNDMAGTQIVRPQLKAWTQALYDHQYVSSGVSLDFTQANFHKIITSGDVTLSFDNWPAISGANAIGYGVMRVWIQVASTDHNVILPASVSISVGDISGYNATTGAITFDATGDYIFEFSSIDGGNTYMMFDLSRDRASFRDHSIYYNPDVNTTFLVGYPDFDSLNTALALEQGQDTISTYGSHNSVSVGNLSLANVSYYKVGNTVGLAGYTVTSARGNLTSTSYITPVHSNDLLGYFNALAFTGNGTGSGNAFEQTASIDFFATGSNIAYGLGGNIAFFTSPDGGTTDQQKAQAVSINNDQSVTAMGNVTVQGRLISNGARVTTGTMVKTFATSGNNTFVANAYVDGVIITSSAYATVAVANITLPSYPVNGQLFRISTVSPITLANVNTSDSSAIVWVPTNKFTSGNTSVELFYNSTNTTWYLR
jgi:hypothetical protein